MSQQTSSKSDSVQTDWDYSHVPFKEWDYAVQETVEGPVYSVIKTNPDHGVTWFFFNEFINIATFGPHSGRTLSFTEFMNMPNSASKTPADVLDEVRAHIIKHRVARTT